MTSCIFDENKIKVGKKLLLALPTLKGGGAEKVFVKLANHLVHLGYEVTILASYGHDYDHIIDQKVKVVRIRSNPYARVRKLNGFIRMWYTYVYLKKLIKTQRLDTVMTTIHETNIAGYFATKHTRFTGTFALRLANIYMPHTLAGFLRPLLRKALRNADKVIANSPDTLASFKALEPELSTNTHIIGNPAYKAPMLDAIKDPTLPNDYLIAVGRLEPQKNYPLMLKAFQWVAKQYPDLHLLILGKGRMQEELMQLRKELALEHRVSFKGFVKNPENLYQGAKAFVLSSDFEGFGNVIVEAMSFGLPVISSRCQGGPTYILNRPGLGELCTLKDADALAAGIIKVLQHPEDYPTEEIKKRAQDFATPAIARQYESALF